MRTALRDDENTKEVNIIVPDRFAAERQSDLISGSRMERIGNFDLPRKTSLTQSQKNNRCVARKIRNELVSTNPVPVTSLKRLGTDSMDIHQAGNGPTCFVTFCKTEKSYKAEDMVFKQLDLQELIRKFKTLSNALIDQKSDVELFCPSAFNPDLEGDGFRTNEKFVGASFLVLDFDDGDLSPDDFIQLFGPDAPSYDRHSFLICNTFSRSPNQPNKFRVMMFFRKPAVTVDQYHACFDYVVSRLEKAGFPPKSSGLDVNSQKPTQLYRLPGTNRAYPEWALFKPFYTHKKELERFGLDPHTLFVTTPVEPINVTPRITNNGDNEEEINELRTKLAGMKKGRHGLQYRFARNLAFGGRNPREIETELRNL